MPHREKHAARVEPAVGTPTREISCENPDCGRAFHVPDALVGHAVRCPHCQCEMRAPGAVEKPALPGSQRWFRVRIRSGPAFEDREFELDPARSYCIGRSDEVEIHLPGEHVSRRHASFHWVNSHWVLEDLNSTHHTEVNGRRILRQQLNEGDKIRLGGYVLEFLPPRRLHAEHTLLNALPVEVAAPSLKVEPPARHDESKLETQRHDLYAAGSSFETHRDVQETYRTAARDVRIRQALWAVGSIAVVLAVLWTFDLIGGAKPKPKAPERTPRGPAPAQLASSTTPSIPAEFTTALRERRFADARREIEKMEQSAPAAGATKQMRVTFDRDLNTWNATLLQEAKRAQNDKKWDDLAQILAKADDQELERFSGQWGEFRQADARRKLLASLQRIRESGKFDEAFALADEKRSELAASPELSELFRKMQEEARCGLRVRVEPSGVAARIRIDDGEAVPIRPGETQWRLTPGKTKVAVEAAGFRTTNLTVQLEPGVAQVIRANLSPMTPGPLWTIYSLRSNRHAAGLWLVARYFSQSAEPAIHFSRADLVGLEQSARRDADTTKPRVAQVTLRDKTTLVGQVWLQPTFVSIRLLPSGEKRTLQTEELAATEDVPVARAIRLLADFAYTQQKEEGDAAAALDALGAIALQFAEAPEAVAETTPYVRKCLEDLERACAVCCGAGHGPCLDCAGAGSVDGEIECPRCKGTRTLTCLTCQGSGKEACLNCGGDGKVTQKVRRGIWVEERYNPCPACHATGRRPCSDCPHSTGKRECSRCRGNGKIVGKGECPTCKGEKRTPCLVCDGEGKREQMTPEARDAAESAALEVGRPAGP